jgi:hypothetical protein
MNTHTHTSRYVPAPSKRGPFMGLKDNLGLLNPTWPYKTEKTGIKLDFDRNQHSHGLGLKHLVNPNWPYKKNEE